MLQALVHTAGRLLDDFNRSFLRGRTPATAAPAKYQALVRVVLTDEVARTLFEEYAAHREGVRGDEETGWILLGLRERAEAVVLATLPAGADCNAGVAHVRFNSNAQALGSRIVRQADRRLTILGVVHTHPGSLRHPSDGDYRGDSVWVGHLRGGDGVFGIGTVDAGPEGDPVFARQPKPHVQCWGDMRLSWYGLRHGDRGYRPLDYAITLGPDLARPLHPVWSTLEAHAEPLDRLYRQQARVTFEVAPGEREPALAVDVALAEPGNSVRVLVEGKEVRYFVRLDGELLAADSEEARVDRGVYLLLAELAAQR
ncbi:MAG TPA: Mov34/MPN/PAD-1 family protein [Gemmataceae bacterium]|jgi:proteasome lid subunit RPN8/RPN11|nr:Mov34/MPN/PAD-1 family protein [Gemmataceae bacterium]